MLRFFVLFIVIQSGLFFLELLNPVRTAVIIPFTEQLAAVSGHLIKAFDEEVVTQGIVVRSTRNQFAVSIEAGCNGVEAMIILLAAIVAFPAPVWHKLLGIVLGALAIQGLNLVRIISLFYLGQWNATAFEWAHLYLWQMLVMLDALIVFLIWIYKIPRGAKTKTKPQPEPAHAN